MPAESGVHSWWRGAYFDGRTAARHPVNVEVMETGLRIVKEDGAVQWWPYEEIRQTPGTFATEHVQFERGAPPPELLVIDDARIVAALGWVSPHRRPRVRPAVRGAQWLRLIALASAGAVAVGTILYLWVIPALAGVVAARLPVSWEEDLGETVVARLTAGHQTCTEPTRLGVLNRILSRLTAAAPANPYTFRLSVVASPEVNAFAAPGGYVVVFDGLLRKTQTPEELAGILAHEIQHVLHRDGTRALVRHISLSGFIALISGDARGLATVLETAGTLGTLRYSREAEAGADREGMVLLQSARIAPQGMVTFLTRIRDEQARTPRALTYLSNHPHIDDRIAALRRQAGETGSVTSPLVAGYPWPQIARICR